MPSPIIIETTKEHQHSVIWLHGLGADASDFEPIIPMLKNSNQGQIRWIFPYAPVAPVTINNKEVMPSWFDISSMDIKEGTNMDDVVDSASSIAQLIDSEVESLKSASKVHLVGFSQGGVVVLEAAQLRSVGSVLALSSFHPNAPALTFDTKTSIAVMHGKFDTIIPLTDAQSTHLAICRNTPAQWFSFNMGHELCVEQIEEIDRWFKKVCQ